MFAKHLKKNFHMDSLVGIVALVLSIIVLLSFGGIALYYSTKIKNTSKDDDAEFFLTARNSQTAANIAWSFYSSTVGAWYIFVYVLLLGYYLYPVHIQLIRLEVGLINLL